MSWPTWFLNQTNRTIVKDFCLHSKLFRKCKIFNQIRSSARKEKKKKRKNKKVVLHFTIKIKEKKKCTLAYIPAQEVLNQVLIHGKAYQHLDYGKTKILVHHQLWVKQMLVQSLHCDQTACQNCWHCFSSKCQPTYDQTHHRQPEIQTAKINSWNCLEIGVMSYWHWNYPPHVENQGNHLDEIRQWKSPHLTIQTERTRHKLLSWNDTTPTWELQW